LVISETSLSGQSLAPVLTTEPKTTERKHANKKKLKKNKLSLMQNTHSEIKVSKLANPSSPADCIIYQYPLYSIEQFRPRLISQRIITEQMSGGGERDWLLVYSGIL